MKKKLATVISIFFVLATFAILFYQNQNDHKRFEDLLGTNETNITKIFMRDVSNGITVETTDKERIKDFINLLNARYYKRSLNQDDKVGHHYCYNLFTGDKQMIRITGDGDTIEINNTYYDVSIPISLDSLTDWFNSLSVNDAYSITFKGESKDWTAEYKADVIVTSIDIYDLNKYKSNKSLIVTYKNDLADLAKVKKWEISCKHNGGSVTRTETCNDKDNPINSKTFVINCGRSLDSYRLDKKDDVIKVSINIDGNIQKLDLKCKP